MKYVLNLSKDQQQRLDAEFALIDCDVLETLENVAFINEFVI